MEILIMICLIIIIGLLLTDKIVFHKRSEQNPKLEKLNQNLPDIMGQPKPVKSLSVPITANESQIVEHEINPDNLDIEYDVNESISIQIRKTEREEVFSNIPNWKEEEEEWNRYGISGGEDSLAQGVTFDELGTVGALFEKEHWERAQKETVVAIVQKLQGTELFSLLENSMEGASRKIAELLDRTLSIEKYKSSSIMQKDDFTDFDIREFV